MRFAACSPPFLPEDQARPTAGEDGEVPAWLPSVFPLRECSSRAHLSAENPHRVISSCAHILSVPVEVEMGGLPFALSLLSRCALRAYPSRRAPRGRERRCMIPTCIMYIRLDEGGTSTEAYVLQKARPREGQARDETRRGPGW